VTSAQISLADIMHSVGRMETKIDAAHIRLDELSRKVEKLDRAVDEGRGGVKMLLWILGALGAIAAAGAWTYDRFIPHP